MPYLKNPFFTIYMYTAPDGRKYIGKTRLQQGARAGAQGAGYKTCKRFWKAIQEFGWDSFEYQVLATIPLSEPERACKVESDYIQKYHTTNLCFGFNIMRKDVPRRYDKQSESRRGRKIMHKGSAVRYVPMSDVPALLESGWELGYSRAS